MKRFATALAVSALALTIGASVASAGTDDEPDYPPGDETVLLLSESVVGPGEEFSATLTDCLRGETVDFSVEGDAASAICTNPEATATLTAPTAEGTYTVSGAGQVSGAADTAEIVVDAGDDGDDGDDGELPATGSSSSGTIAQIGAGLLVGGLGLVTVARLRRRRPVGA